MKDKNLPVWYGWIPILSGELSISIEYVEYKARTLSEEIKALYDVKYSHEELNKWPNKWEIELLKTENRLKLICEVESNGLCKITPANGTATQDNISACYRFVRDIYYQHIHHSGDQLLDPIETNDRPDAIEKILKQYRKKIVEYHRVVRELITLGILKSEDAIIDRISTGRGEMQYAKSFINLFFSKDSEQRENLLRVFENADKSLEILMEKVRGHEPIRTVNLTIIAITFAVFFGVFNITVRYYDLYNVVLLSIFCALFVDLVFTRLLT